MSSSAGVARDAQRASEEGIFSAHERSPLQHLLHALNQPLTGLQCSLELALSSQRTPEQYLRTLRDGLDLTARMRLLVEALRELAEIERENEFSQAYKTAENREAASLTALLRETVDELRPVAESKGVQMQFEGRHAAAVRFYRHKFTAVLFRFLESAVSLATVSSRIEVSVAARMKESEITIGWNEAATAPEHSPFSRPELGLLIAQASWKRAGGSWERTRTGRRHTLLLRWPLAITVPDVQTAAESATETTEKER